MTDFSYIVLATVIKTMGYSEIAKAINNHKKPPTKTYMNDTSIKHWPITTKTPLFAQLDSICWKDLAIQYRKPPFINDELLMIIYDTLEAAYHTQQET